MTPLRAPLLLALVAAVAAVAAAATSSSGSSFSRSPSAVAFGSSFVPRRRLPTASSSSSSVAFVPSAASAAASSDARRRRRTSVATTLRAAAVADVVDDPAPPIPTEWRSEVLSALSSVVDPDLNADIVSLGFVKNLEVAEETAVVSFDVELTTPACPVKDQFASECHKLVTDLPWTTDAKVTMTAQPSPIETDSIGMAQIGAVVAVSSCKGGVGKSTTAVNLAYALRDLGASVGIFDADVYGPSLPTMVAPDDDAVRFVGRQIAPLRREGVKLMSFGYVNDGSAVMRGPMVTQLLDQFLSLTHWGPLDYLVLDMPPGTGDIQLTLSQRLNITAAVIVTTPQELSFADVVRGIDMFDSVEVPCVAVVENMAYYETDSSTAETAKTGFDPEALGEEFASTLKEEGVSASPDGKTLEEVAQRLARVVVARQEEATTTEINDSDAVKERVEIFGKGHKRRLADQYGIEHAFSVPLRPDVASSGDSGLPFLLEHPDSSTAKTYRELAASVVQEVSKAKFASSDKSSRKPVVSYDEQRHLLEINDGESHSLSPATLRRECRCASCVEELTGRQILVPSDVSEDVKPTTMGPCGNYALSVDWSDGHRSLYPYRQIRSLLSSEEELKEEGTKEEAKEAAATATV